MSKDSKTLSGIKQVLLDTGVNLKVNTERFNTIMNLTFGEDDFIEPAKGVETGLFSLKDTSRVKAVTIMRIYFESISRYHFFCNLEAVIKTVSEKPILRDDYEGVLVQLQVLRDIIKMEVATVEKAMTFSGSLVSPAYFPLISKEISSYMQFAFDDVISRGSSETMLRRFILKCANFLHYMQWANQPDSFGELVIGEDLSQSTYDRIRRCFVSWTGSDKNFLQRVPVLYDVIDDVSDERQIPTKDNGFILDAGFVKCAGTGKLTSVKDCIETVYGTYVSKQYLNTPDGRLTWTTCPYSDYKSVKLIDIVCVKDYNNKSAGHVYINTANRLCGDGLWLHPDNKRWYNFDIVKQNCYVMGRGWFTKKDAETLAVYEPGLGMYIVKGKEFTVFPHTEDVLDHFEGFKHMPYEQVTKGRTLFLGMELEVEMSQKATIGKDQAARDTMVAMKGECIVVRDGTLNNGYEIVSVPATLNYHHEMWKGLLRSELRRQIVSYKRKSCGIHIHMSKDAFSQLALGKFMTFITHPKNSAFIEAIAQRGSNDYNIRKQTKVSNARNKLTLDGNFMGHYYAVNLDKPHTIEVRIFKGTLHYPSVMKNLEFCHALHSWVSSLECSINDVENYKKFCDYVKRNRLVYSFLYDFLKNHKGAWIKDNLRDISESSTNDVTDEHTETGSVEVLVRTPIPIERVALIRRATTAVRTTH